MSLVPPSQILHDLATVETARGRAPNWAQVVYLTVGLVTAALVLMIEPSSFSTGPLLTATSIMTGLTFTLALRFWERSLDARRDPRVANDGRQLALIDRMKSHLVWTVLVGLSSTLTFVLIAIFGTTSLPTGLMSAASGLVVYQVVLVLGGLVEFYRASYDLRP